MTPLPTPPTAAERLLAAVVRDAEWRDTILGDLREEFVAIGKRSGRGVARRWYWRHALAIGGRAVVARVGGGRMPRRTWIVSPDLDEPRSWRSGFIRELTHAWRAIIRRPATSAVIVLTLALALAANSTTLSIADALVLRPFRFPGFERVTFVATVNPQDNFIDQDSVAPADFREWREQVTTLAHLSAAEWWDANLSGIEQPEQVAGFRVTAGFFEALGTSMALGRTFEADEETIGRNRLAILGDSLWRRRFGGDPTLVGRTVRLDGEQYEVVGIAPPHFNIPLGAEVWAPLAFDQAASQERKRGWLTVIGRLHDGVELPAARAEIEGIVERQRKAYPDTNATRPIMVVDFTTGFQDPGAGPFMAVFQASAFLLLLIACANIANLLLARGAERAQEFAIRLALGASRARLASQMILEGTLMSAMAFMAAIPLALAGIGLSRGGIPPSVLRFVPGWRFLSLNSEVLLATAAVAFVATLLFSIVPALHAARSGVSDTLRHGARATGSRKRQWARNILATSQVALTLALLFGAGLVLTAADSAVNGALGFDRHNVLTARMTLPTRPYTDPQTRRQFFDTVTERMRAIPAVAGVGITSHLPYAGASSSTELWPEGVELQQQDVRQVDYRRVSDEYLSTLRIPLLEGRQFNSGDRPDTEAVAIVSRSLVTRYWPGENAIGKRIKLSATGAWITVVGVSGEVLHDWFRERRTPTIYRPVSQDAPLPHSVVVRTVGDPMSVASDLRRAVAAADPDQPILELTSMEQVVVNRAAGVTFIARSLGVVALVALVLAVTGLYSLMAYMASRRTQEIGLRMALGARRWQVIRLASKQAIWITGTGILLGGALAAGLGKAMESVLLGMVSTSLLQLAALISIVTVVALVAAYLPARRAAAIDPSTALRAD